MGSIGVLTAGGDCPGLNAVIRAVTVRVVEDHGRPVVGILNGWDGLMEGRVRPLDRDSVRGILQRGGTILGTSRRDPYVHGEGSRALPTASAAHEIDSLVVVGGDGTLRSAQRLADEGLPVVAVPKTIDNDIAGTDITFGFDTAVQIGHRGDRPYRHHRRGAQPRHAGRSDGPHPGMDRHLRRDGRGGRRDAHPRDPIRPGRGRRRDPHPEGPWEELLDRRRRRGDPAPEGTGAAPQPVDAFGFARLGGVAYLIAPILEEKTGFEARVTVLGHLQRGGTPTAFDRVLGTRFGAAAADLAVQGASGMMVALRGNKIEPIPLSEATSAIRGIDPAIYNVATTFFG